MKFVCTLGAACLWLATAVAAQPATQAAAQSNDTPACPPVARPPTPEQVQQGMQRARDRGFLWRLHKDGRTSYLYGTIHVGKMAWAFPGPQVRSALQATRTVAVELDITDPALAKQLSAPPKGGTMPVLPPALRERLDKQAAASCIPKDALATLHPVMQAITYTVLAGRWDGLDPSWGQELVLIGVARGGGRPVVSLETAELQTSALIPDEPDAALKMIDQTLTQLERNRVRPVLTRVASVWESGDLQQLSSYEQWCDCANTAEERAALDRVLHQRNPGLADRIADTHAKGEPVFAAVGALHMVGPQALPRLLEERGFKVERVRFAE
jgi:uncharacterized protein